MPRYELNLAPTPDRQGINPFTRQSFDIPGRAGKRLFAEVAQDGCRIVTWEGSDLVPGRKVERSYPEELQADQARIKFISRLLRRGFVEIGPCVELAEGAAVQAYVGSVLAFETYLEAGDDRLLQEVFALPQPEKLASVAERWYRDKRPTVRQALLSYIDDGCDRPKHKPLVKRLFKLAEAAGDDEAMGHFLVAFDGFGTRRLRRRTQWDWVTGEHRELTTLERDPTIRTKLPPKAKSSRFTRCTRVYLARRSFRYFRRLGFKDLARYGRCVRAALVLYREQALSSPARLLDAWGLLHILYGHSPVLRPGRLGMIVVRGRSLAELEPAPYFPEAWKGIPKEILSLVPRAASRTVRKWGIEMLRRNEPDALEGVPVSELRPLLASPHSEVQAFGAELLGKASGIEALSIQEWLGLLRIESLEVASQICELVVRLVEPSRLTLQQCVELGLSGVAKVAELGVGWAKDKGISSAEQLRVVLPLVCAPVQSARESAAAWLADLVANKPFAGSEHLRELLDARSADARAKGLACLDATERYRQDTALWFALAESPYSDIRSFVVTRAAAWDKEAWPATLRWVWSGVVLAIRQGSRLKQRVPRQIAQRLVEHPEEADSLLPILGLALRSVRPPERAAALGALARAATLTPALRASLLKHLPEVAIGTEVSS